MGAGRVGKALVVGDERVELRSDLESCRQVNRVKRSKRCWIESSGSLGNRVVNFSNYEICNKFIDVWLYRKVVPSNCTPRFHVRQAARHNGHVSAEIDPKRGGLCFIDYQLYQGRAVKVRAQSSVPLFVTHLQKCFRDGGNTRRQWNGRGQIRY